MITAWKQSDNGAFMAGPTYGVGENGPRFIVSTDDPDDLLYLVSALNDASTLDRIHGAITGQVWTPDTLDQIAELLQQVGRTIDPPKEETGA